jgi:hypothetical protein
VLKSTAVVIGSYLLSIVLVLATDPLLSRLFPGDFVRGRVPSNAARRSGASRWTVGAESAAPARLPRYWL